MPERGSGPAGAYATSQVPELVAPRFKASGCGSSLSLGAVEGFLEQYHEETIAETDCTIAERAIRLPVASCNAAVLLYPQKCSTAAVPPGQEPLPALGTGAVSQATAVPGCWGVVWAREGSALTAIGETVHSARPQGCSSGALNRYRSSGQ